MQEQFHQTPSDKFSQNIAGFIMLSLPAFNAFWCLFWYLAAPKAATEFLFFIRYQHWPLITRFEKTLEFHELDITSLFFVPLSIISTEIMCVIWLLAVPLLCFSIIPLARLRVGTKPLPKYFLVGIIATSLWFMFFDFDYSYSVYSITLQRPFISTLLLCAFMFPFLFWLLLVVSVQFILLMVDGVGLVFRRVGRR